MMNNFEVAENFFPLKERVRGGMSADVELYEQNLSELAKEMYQLRQSFGTKIYDRRGNTVLLEMWSVGHRASNTPPQLRWVITAGDNKKKFTVTASMVETINKATRNHLNLTQMLKTVNSELFELIMETEIKRVQINSRSKASQKVLHELTHLLDCQNTKQMMRSLLVAS